MISFFCFTQVISDDEEDLTPKVRLQKHSLIMNIRCGGNILSHPRACSSKVSKPFGHILGDIVIFVSLKRRRLEARNFAVILYLFPLQHIKRPALQNKRVVVVQVAFRALKVMGPFDKRAPCQNFFCLCVGPFPVLGLTLRWPGQLGNFAALQLTSNVYLGSLLFCRSQSRSLIL